MQSDIDALQSSIFFADLPPEHLAQLAMHTIHRRFPEGAVIFREGDPGNCLFLIIEGEVKITVDSPTGQEITLALLGPGDAFGELSLLDGSLRSATTTTTAPSDLLVVYRDNFLQVVETAPAAVSGVLSALARIIRGMNEKLADVAMLDVHGRMAKALLGLMKKYGVKVEDGILIDREISGEDLAGLVGMYPAHVERLMRDYQYEFILRHRDSHITILRPEVLEQALHRYR